MSKKKAPSSYEYLVIDFETQDKYLGLKLGSGWVYGDIWIGGCAIQYPDGSNEYLIDRAKYKKIINKAETLIVFNANYDVGILKMLKLDIEQFRIIDVLIMAKMHCSVERVYSLNLLSKKYLKDKKSDAPLGDLATELGLVKSKTQNPVKVAKENMKALQNADIDLVAEYAIHDVVLTYKLYEFLLTKESTKYYNFDFYSDLIKVCILNRAKGVCIDLVQLLKVECKLTEALLDAQLKLNEYNDGIPTNVYSPKDIPELLEKYNIEIPLSEKGNPAVDKHYLSTVNHDVPRQILTVRELRTLKTSFVDKIIEIQKYTIKADKQDFGSKHLHGYIYPELQIMGAAATGRFSCSGPNIQQIPSRGGEIAKLIRSFIVAHPGDEMFGAFDFSAQEPRLQIHYTYLANCEGAKTLVDEYRADPNTDFHSLAASVMGVERSIAKTIGLGLLYGMGLQKLAVSLDEPVEKARELKDLYFQSLPAIKELITKTSLTLKTRGYITTVGGRKIHLDPSAYIEGERKTFEYKALNKLIQGSAADQTMAVMVELYRRDIDFLFAVHDEIDASLIDESHAAQIKEVMETAIKLEIPSVSEGITGKSWADCKG